MTDYTPIAYEVALNQMSLDVLGLQEGNFSEKVWLLEHPPLYTAGTSAKDQDYLGAQDIPVYKTGRGGQYTYHGPGQRIAYLMLDLKKRGQDVREYVRNLEQLGIDVLKEFGVQAARDEAGVGLWVKNGVSQNKIAAIGVRISRWITSHGIAFNVNPDLDHYKGIVPCGIHGHGVTSLKALGIDISMEDFDKIFQGTFLNNAYFNR